MRFAPLVPKPTPSDSTKSKVKCKPAQPLASSHAPSPEPEHSQFGEPVAADADFDLWSGYYAARNNKPLDANRWQPLHRTQNSSLFRSAKLSGHRLPKLEPGDTATMDSWLRNFKYESPANLSELEIGDLAAMDSRLRNFKHESPPNLSELELGGFAAMDPRLRNFKYESPAILAKLEVGGVDDPLEREADEIAEKVMRMPAPTTAGHGSFAGQRSLPGSPGFVADRKCAGCESEEDSLHRMVAEPVISRACSTCEDEDELRRECASCDAEDEKLLRASASCDVKQLRRERGAGLRGGGLSETFAAQVRGRVRLGGSPLSSGVRDFLEPRLGVELQRVRVHADAEAGSLARKINARAFTLGQDIFFAPGELRPQTHSGMRLLAHEVAHTLQTAAPDGELARNSSRPSLTPYSHGSTPPLLLHRGFALERSGASSAAILRRAPADDLQAPAWNGQCTNDSIEASELEKAKRDSKLLERWLAKVKKKDLRFDFLRSIRARRARRVCLVASCDPDAFNGLLDGEVKDKLACFDEAHYGGKLRGICGQRLGAECATGTPPPPKQQRKRLTNKAVDAELTGRGLSSEPEPGHEYEKLGTDSVLIAELVRVKHLIESALGELRILLADMSVAGRAKVPLRSRGTKRAFENSFGEATPAKLQVLEALLTTTQQIMAKGWDISETSDKFVPDKNAVPDPRQHEVCKYVEDELDYGDCVYEAANLSDEALDQKVAMVQQEHANDTKDERTKVAWRDKSQDPHCAASGGYHSEGRIAVCVDPEKDATELQRANFRATLLHEYFHKVLEGFELDVYAKSPLYPSLAYLESDAHGALGLRNPDSLTYFVLVAAKTGGTRANAAMPMADRSMADDSCDTKRIVLALGVAYEWLRLGELENTRKVDFHEQYPQKNTEEEAKKAKERLEGIRTAMARLSEAGQDRRDITKSIIDPDSGGTPAEPEFVPPPKVEVDIRAAGDPIVVKPVGSKLLVRVGSDFLNADLPVQVELLLAKLKVEPSLIADLHTAAKKDSEYQLIEAASLTGCSRQ